MSHKYKTAEGKVYYVTLTVIGWIDIFTRKDYVEELISNIQYCQKNKGLNVYAYVIMPNHLHMVCSRETQTVNELLRDFKSFTSKKLISMVKQHPRESRKEWMMHMFRFFGKGNPANEVFQFWENGSHPIELNSPEILKQKIEYIHMNPVKAGFVEKPWHWKYSSAYEFSEIKVLPV